MWWHGAILALLLWQAPKSDPAADGMKALDEQRWDAAVASFSKAIEADPKDYSHRFHLAFAHSMLRHDAEAIASYRQTLEIKPGLYEAQLNLGILLLQTKQAAEAAPLLEQAAQTKPKEFRPVYYAAEALSATGQTAKAVPLFKSAVEINPKSPEAELGLARALAKENNLDEAAAHFRKAAEAQPEILLELAMLYEASGQRDQAMELYRKFPGNAAARERLGELLLEGGKADEAIAELESAVKESPTTANRYALAMAYNTAKQYAKAEPLFVQVLEGEPGNLDIRMTYARVLREQKKYAPAAQEFFKVAQAKPDSAEAWSDLAGMLILIENYQGAVAALDKVKALGAEKAAHHYFRAIVLDKHKMYKPALASYEQFLSMSEGKHPDEEFKARQRVRIIRKELEKR
jgi:tetratricopeptide (TPR) repeat protein